MNKMLQLLLMKKRAIGDRIYDSDVDSLLISFFEHNKTAAPDFTY